MKVIPAKKKMEAWSAKMDTPSAKMEAESKGDLDNVEQSRVHLNP